MKIDRTFGFKRCLNVRLIAVCLAVSTGAVQAQTLYRIVGPDGRVTFTDQAPSSSIRGNVSAAGLRSGTSAAIDLPYELRQPTAKFPVTLYTTDKCGSCASGRQLLSVRGIPFAERTVTTADDVAALQRLSGENSLPVLTIGTQLVRGYSDSEWHQYLDAAGYPKTSILPAAFKNAAPAPLVAVQKPASAPPEAAREAPAIRPVAPAPASVNTNNPTGLVF